MAQLKDTIITGDASITGTLYPAKIQGNTIWVPTSSGGTTYGAGTSGQVLKTNGTTVYWASDSNSDTWRNIQVNGTQILGTGTNTGALNLKSGTNVTVSNSSGTVTFTGPSSAASNTTGITATTTATKTTLGNAFSIPNVTGNSDVTVPIRADSDTTVPTAASSATACDDITSWTTNTPTVVTKKTVVTSVTNATASYADGIITFTNGANSTGDSVTVTAGTAATLNYTARSITGVTGSTTVRGVKTGTSSTTTASKVTLGNAFSVPNVTGNTSATVSISDPGHTHTLS